MNIQELNSIKLYAIVGAVIIAIVIMCVVFMVKSWKAGIKIGMEKSKLRKVVFSSASFTLLPSLSILLGVVALSGTLGVPLPWLRLSVIGNLQYEINVAQIASTGIGLSGLKLSEMTPEAFVTIALVMTAGILGGVLMCIFTLKAYSKKLKGKKTDKTQNAENSNNEKPQKNFGDWAMIAMFVGMCATYIGSYIGLSVQKDFLPLITALAAAFFMIICELLERKKHYSWLENFDLALSMLFAMAVAVAVNPML